MNIFRPVSCINLKDEHIQNTYPDMKKSSYNGPIVILENTLWTGLFLFFPTSKRNMDLINQAMSGSPDVKALSIYRTMIDSWKGSGNYLAGIIMDLSYEPNSDQPKMIVNFALASSSEGTLQSLVPVSFVDSVIISVILKQDYMVGVRLLNLMLPENKVDGDNDDEYHGVHNDQNIKNIVKDILEGKIQDQSDNEDEDEEDEDED